MAAKKKTKLKLKLTNGGSRLQQLQSIANQCNTALGAIGKVYLGRDQPIPERISTGIIALDYVLGGGLVRGQMVQFTGADGCFKTTAALMCVAKVQREGGMAVWVAGEGFDVQWAAKHGVNIDELLVISTAFGDTTLETAMTLIESNLIDLMVFDSFQSLGTTREMEGAVDDEAYAGAGAPQMWGRVMRKAYAAVAKGSRAAIIGISQVRAPIGKYGVTEDEGTQIKALKHWKVADIMFKKGEISYEGDATEKRRLNSRVFKLKCQKNKSAESERQASFTFERVGKTWKVDNLGTLLRLALAYEVIGRSGAWYEGFGIRAQGEEKYLAKLSEKPKLQRKIRRALFETLDG